jgi:hypothetical protein
LFLEYPRGGIPDCLLFHLSLCDWDQLSHGRQGPRSLDEGGHESERIRVPCSSGSGWDSASFLSLVLPVTSSSAFRSFSPRTMIYRDPATPSVSLFSSIAYITTRAIDTNAPQWLLLKLCRCWRQFIRYAFSATLCTLLTLLIYCRYKSIITKLITTDITVRRIRYDYCISSYVHRKEKCFKWKL